MPIAQQHVGLLGIVGGCHVARSRRRARAPRQCWHQRRRNPSVENTLRCVLFVTSCVRSGQMLFHLAPFVSLAGPLDGANGGPLAWVDDQTTYNFTTSPEYGDSSYPLGYNELWSPQWQHFVSSFEPAPHRPLACPLSLREAFWGGVLHERMQHAGPNSDAGAVGAAPKAAENDEQLIPCARIRLAPELALHSTQARNDDRSEFGRTTLTTSALPLVRGTRPRPGTFPAASSPARLPSKRLWNSLFRQPEAS